MTMGHSVLSWLAGILILRHNLCSWTLAVKNLPSLLWSLRGDNYFKTNLHISFLVTGFQKLTNMDDEGKLQTLFEKHTATEVTADNLGEERKSFMGQVSNGNNEQGFSKNQGVLIHAVSACY